MPFIISLDLSYNLSLTYNLLELITFQLITSYNILQKIISYNHIITHHNQFMSSETDEHENNSEHSKKKKRGQSKFDKETPKYQCYCEKIYLSYPALYLHLKNKHPECFMNNRKIEVTKFKESLSPDGFKILKMEKQKIEFTKTPQNYVTEEEFQKKNIPSFPFQGYDPFPFPNRPNYGMHTMPPKNYFMQNKMTFPRQVMQPMNNSYSIDSSRQKSERQSKNLHNLPKVMQRGVFLCHMNKYFQQSTEIQNLSQKSSLQLELLYNLLIQCIRQKSQRIKTLYKLDCEALSSLDCRYLEGVLPYFRSKYLHDYIKEHSTAKNDASLSQQQKWVQTLLKVSKYFTDQQQSTRQIMKFQGWLLKNNVIQKIQTEKIDILS